MLIPWACLHVLPDRNRSGNEGHNICVTDGAGNLFEASEHLSDENLENILDSKIYRIA